MIFIWVVITISKQLASGEFFVVKSASFLSFLVTVAFVCGRLLTQFNLKKMTYSSPYFQVFVENV